VSDGSIGDTAHSARKSDHNPNAQGVVTAIDITADTANGVDGHELSRTLAQDGRTKYVIFAGEIYRSYKPHLGWTKYTGANPHNKHVHISVLASNADDDALWANIGEARPKIIGRSTLRYKDRGSSVQDLQRLLGIEQDGVFGNLTLHAVREFQEHHGLEVDGIAGPRFWAVIDKSN
jgi:peptidoglycan hydrolase-like protein with peptidoglycan-binding domain